MAINILLWGVSFVILIRLALSIRKERKATKELLEKVREDIKRDIRESNEHNVSVTHLERFRAKIRKAEKLALLEMVREHLLPKSEK